MTYSRHAVAAKKHHPHLPLVPFAPRRGLEMTGCICNDDNATVILTTPVNTCLNFFDKEHVRYVLIFLGEQEGIGLNEPKIKQGIVVCCVCFIIMPGIRQDGQYIDLSLRPKSPLLLSSHFLPPGYITLMLSDVATYRQNQEFSVSVFSLACGVAVACEI